MVVKNNAKIPIDFEILPEETITFDVKSIKYKRGNVKIVAVTFPSSVKSPKEAVEFLRKVYSGLAEYLEVCSAKSISMTLDMGILIEIQRQNNKITIEQPYWSYNVKITTPTGSEYIIDTKNVETITPEVLKELVCDKWEDLPY